MAFLEEDLKIYFHVSDFREFSRLGFRLSLWAAYYQRPQRPKWPKAAEMAESGRNVRTAADMKE
jgi:hypothetical protein